MTMERKFSDEFLNSFVDNQLTPEEKSQAYLDISQDPALNRDVCELRKLHDLVQLAYRDVPRAPALSKKASRWYARARFGVAASFLLALGISLGILIPSVSHETEAGDSRPTAAVAYLGHNAVPMPAVVSTQDSKTTTELDLEEAPISHYTPSLNPSQGGEIANKVLIHVTYNDETRVKQMLDEVEGLLRYYQDTGQHAHIEVMVNGHGLDLLRRDTSHFAGAVARLLKEHSNLTFAACQNTIDRVKREQGLTVRLLPGVIVIDSGMAEIMRRQDQGWAYLQV